MIGMIRALVGLTGLLHAVVGAAAWLVIQGGESGRVALASDGAVVWAAVSKPPRQPLASSSPVFEPMVIEGRKYHATALLGEWVPDGVRQVAYLPDDLANGGHNVYGVSHLRVIRDRVEATGPLSMQAGGMGPGAGWAGLWQLGGLTRRQWRLQADPPLVDMRFSQPPVILAHRDRVGVWTLTRGGRQVTLSADGVGRLDVRVQAMSVDRGGVWLWMQVPGGVRIGRQGFSAPVLMPGMAQMPALPDRLRRQMQQQLMGVGTQWPVAALVRLDAELKPVRVLFFVSPVGETPVTPVALVEDGQGGVFVLGQAAGDLAVGSRHLHADGTESFATHVSMDGRVRWVVLLRQRLPSPVRLHRWDDSLWIVAPGVRLIVDADTGTLRARDRWHLPLTRKGGGVQWLALDFDRRQLVVAHRLDGAASLDGKAVSGRAVLIGRFDWQEVWK